MLINIGGTTYEFVKTFNVYNIHNQGQKMVQEQKNRIQKFVDKNPDIRVFQNEVNFIVCKEIEEAKYRDINPELTSGEKG